MGKQEFYFLNSRHISEPKYLITKYVNAFVTLSEITHSRDLLLKRPLDTSELFWQTCSPNIYIKIVLQLTKQVLVCFSYNRASHFNVSVWVLSVVVSYIHTILEVFLVIN